MEGITSPKCIFQLHWKKKTKMKVFWYVLSSEPWLCWFFPHNFSVQCYVVLHSSAFTGYVLIVGCLSFTVCYKHGPLVEERSVTLLAWALQLLSLLLVYAGVAIPQFAYAVMLLTLSSKILHYPLRALAYVRWCVFFFFSIINLTFWALVLFILGGNFLDTS